jgi:hypothetical protein
MRRPGTGVTGATGRTSPTGGRRLCVLSGSRYLSIFTSFFPERNDYREVVIAIAEAALPPIDEVPS